MTTPDGARCFDGEYYDCRELLAYLDIPCKMCYTREVVSSGNSKGGNTMMLSYWLGENEDVFKRLTLQVSLQKHGAYWDQNPAELLTDAEEALIGLLIYAAVSAQSSVKHGNWCPQEEIDSAALVLSSLSLSYNA